MALYEQLEQNGKVMVGRILSNFKKFLSTTTDPQDVKFNSLNLGTATGSEAGQIRMSSSIGSLGDHWIRGSISDAFALLNMRVDAGGTGKHGFQLGAGGSTPPDTNLYRDSANVLKTDGSLVVGGDFCLKGTTYIDASPPDTDWVTVATITLGSGGHGGIISYEGGVAYHTGGSYYIKNSWGYTGSIGGAPNISVISATGGGGGDFSTDVQAVSGGDGVVVVQVRRKSSPFSGNPHRYIGKIEVKGRFSTLVKS